MTNPQIKKPRTVDQFFKISRPLIEKYITNEKKKAPALRFYESIKDRRIKELTKKQFAWLNDIEKKILRALDQG